MSKAQKLISGIFALVFALAIAPTASFAATNYDLSVNGEHFTSENSPSNAAKARQHTTPTHRTSRSTMPPSQTR